ncbi:MAG: DNA polymerase I [Clostridiales bacterium]|jgi:DNA polymerase-1|nr:DNA polymerase I [Clostridiales bacterium]
MNKKNKFIIIDGSSLIYRAFFALPLLQTKQGLYTNAVYGFTTMLLRLLDEEKPDYVTVAFDKAKPTFRHVEYSDYKAKREKTPSELSEQISRVRELLAALHIPVVELDGYEADDLIGTFARLANENGMQPVIVSGDADVFQLVDMPAEVIYTRRGITQVERITEKELMERYSLSAQQFIDFKGLKGDASDNIPGVPGVGEKTAIKLLTQFGSMEGIYEHLDEIPGRLHDLLKNNREQAELSKRLATIVTNVPWEFQAADYLRQAPDNEKLRLLFTQLEFKSLLEKLPDNDQEIEQRTVTDETAVTVSEEEDWMRLAEKIGKAKQTAILTLPVGASWQHELQGMTVALPGETYHIPLTTEGGELARAASLFRDTKALTIVYDAKNWINILWRMFCQEPEGPMFDVSLAAYLLDPLENGYPLEKMAERYLDRTLPEAPGKKKGQLIYCERDFSCAAVRALFDLYPVLRAKLADSSLEKLYDDLELPLAHTLARMERRGVAVDLAALSALKIEITGRIAVLEEEVYRLAGETFNLNSPKQLGTILFEKLSLPAIKKTKTGYSTDAQVLEELAPHHDIVAIILQYRTLIKLLTTYLEGLSKLVNPTTGRIHTTFNQTVTATGRLSSTEPNLQNIPIRLEEGRRVRRAFIPGEKGKLLLSADYSQIELRILAHVSNDAVLIDSFRQEEDIHQRTAAEVFGVSQEEVTREMRDKAKAVNFGIIYGISDYGLSRQLGIPRQEAKIYIERYLERYPGVREFIHSVVAEAHKNGFVTTILNRRRYLPDINNRNFNLRSFAERTAMNTPIQGTAADIIKLAMLQVEKVLEPFGDAAKMILQVHDDLVIEVDERVVNEVAEQVRTKMQDAITLSVPLTVDIKAGPNWAEMIKFN